MSLPNLSKDFFEPESISVLLEVGLFIIKVRWNAEQIFTFDELDHIGARILSLSLPNITSVIQDHKESVVTPSQCIQCLATEIELQQFPLYEALGVVSYHSTRLLKHDSLRLAQVLNLGFTLGK
jgi:hypothetical protein